jgi:hypothetical protein
MLQKVAKLVKNRPIPDWLACAVTKNRADNGVFGFASKMKPLAFSRAITISVLFSSWYHNLAYCLRKC